MEGAERVVDPLSADWVSLLLLACLLVLTTINVGSPRKWRVLRQSVWRLRMGQQTLREEVDLRDRNVLGLLLVAAVSIALFLWQAGVWHGVSHMPSLSMLAGSIITLLVAQAFLLWMVSTLVSADGGGSEYLFSGSLLFASLGIVLLPVAALIAYQPAWRDMLLVIGLGLMGAMLLYRWVRGVWIGLGQGVSPGYIFIYLCAAEIMPLLLALHALQPTIPPTSTT
jgi:Domain of unknown function (DUF4271)